ncbi:MAG: VCBS repeat-containing protein [Cyclobacteriaceae bacterium]
MAQTKYSFLLIFALISCIPVAAQIQFTELVIDKLAHGDDKAVADLDNDGVKDIILGGASLAWYREENGTYVKYKITDPKVEFTTDMQVGDVDNDGDIDLIVADGKDTNAVMWYENPLPEKSPTEGANWEKHTIGTQGDWMHNTAVGDLNMDRHLDFISSGHDFTRLWLNKGKGTWQEINLSEYGGGAVDTYDMDGDGDGDILTTKGWVECPKDAFVAADWKFHPIEGLGETVEAGDLDSDGKADILSADSAHVAGKLHWLKNTGTPANPVWKKTEIDPSAGTHKLQFADFNRDGHTDIMFGLELKAIGILYQDPKKPGVFTKQIVANTGGHNAIADDIDNDGDLDIVSCDFLNHPPLRLFINNSAGKKAPKSKPLSLYRWHYNPITNKAMRTFGLTHGEVTGDGKKDVISGSHIYENPGTSNNRAWNQYLVRDGLHAVVTLDVNGDKKDEIIAMEGNGTIYWCQGSKGDWKIQELGKVPEASHPIGGQGHITGQLIPGGKPEFILTAGKGTYAFQVPDNPSTKWPMIHVTTNTSDEDLDLADFNNDGWNDIAGTNGQTQEVLWFENPKGFKDNWQSHKVGQLPPSDKYLDRVVAGDVNGDKKVDIIMSEETQRGPAATIIFLQPDKAGATWTMRPLVNQYTTNSMDMADVDNDGDLDILTGEHRGDKRLTIWENDGKGKFKSYVIDHGKENHDGAKFADLDNDGDLDIIGIGYDTFSVIHVWWNDAIVK